MDPHAIFSWAVSHWLITISAGAVIGGVTSFLHTLYGEKRDREADLKKLGGYIAELRTRQGSVESRLAGLEHFKTLPPEEAKRLVETISGSLDEQVAQAAH